MQESNSRRTAVIFTVTIILLAVVLFGGVYFLKQRDNPAPGRKDSPTSKPDKKDKSSKNNKNNKRSSSKDKNTQPPTNNSQANSPHEVAPAGPSDFWYVPILGLAALGFVGHEYYLSRQALKKPFNR